jgi:trans-2,3-dihydro-3-hydroxyanthranilate isomerase
MQRDFVTVDVFTDCKFGGNPLAVVLDAEGLTSGQMQAIAAEFNLAETTFVLPPRLASHTAEVRIFTPRFEMPFAGHPNVGTAFVLAMQSGNIDEPLLFEEKAGLVQLDLLRDGATVVGARLKAPQPLQRGGDIAAGIVARACSLDVTDIDLRHHKPCVISCGAKFVVAELKTRASLASALARTEIFQEYIKPEIATGLLLYTFDDADEADIQARMFAPLYGVPEDPATGSANVALAGFLASLRPEPDIKLELRVAQGVDMGRPSLLEAVAEKQRGEVVAMWIGGRCVAMMRGQLEV